MLANPHAPVPSQLIRPMRHREIATKCSTIGNIMPLTKKFLRLRSLRKRRVWIPLALLATLLLTIGHPALFLLHVAWNDRDMRRPPPPGMADDASRINAVPIAQVWQMPAGDNAEAQLRDLLAHARRDHLYISVAGARHSMGGQTLYPGGIQIDMLPFHKMSLDEGKNILTVQAGAIWADIIPFLDARARSVQVMQSNNSFSVGGSLSVDCHGWQPGRPPIASTVESFRLMTADGNILECSHTENPELFSLALGGYGLFGIIIDARCACSKRALRDASVRHALFRFRFLLENAFSIPPMPAWPLARLCVVPGKFLDEAVIYTFNRAPSPDGTLPPLSSLGLEGLTRTLFRGSVDSDYGKKLRWQTETELLTHLAGGAFSRNQLQNESTEVIANRTADSTDILQEYFVPVPAVNDFVAAMRTIIPAHSGNLLNVTLRDVRTDSDAFLRYADRDMIALVLMFNQKFTAADASRMGDLTRDLIDAALAAGGRYYLPYRLEATPEQFNHAYPQAQQFFTLKRKYDPDQLFQNEMYTHYGNTHMSP